MSDVEARELERVLAASPTDLTARRRLHSIRRDQGWGQCDDCGGALFEDIAAHEPRCETCGGTGALPPEHPKIRKCMRAGCGVALAPSHVAVYCSNACAWDDA